MFCKRSFTPLTIGAVVAIFSEIHGSLAAPTPEPDALTLVVYGDFPAPSFAVAVPVGTASGANPVTTYLYNEVVEQTVDSNGQLLNSPAQITGVGTLVASAAGFAVTEVVQEGGHPDGNAAFECDFTGNDSGSCIINEEGGLDTFAGPASTVLITISTQLAFGSPTATGSSSGSGSNLGSSTGSPAGSSASPSKNKNSGVARFPEFDARMFGLVLAGFLTGLYTTVV
ncbi:hypothetical protein D9757_001528 [Collybiopsis confluens]|uniref:Uncharacterized protein n=1 Tax=Collybiopsis confluens TaxID=2823264 RepID=A0A8H5HZJ5_9AGAR|nr:hypothetical protein D9757_001528 [Collybiopsis confluens]